MRILLNPDSGHESAYDLVHGKLEKFECKAFGLILWYEFNQYHVLKHNSNSPFWESFKSLKEAQKLFDSTKEATK